MYKVLSLIMSVALLAALAGCQSTGTGSTQKQASEKPTAAKVSSEGTGEKAGCSKAKSCGDKEKAACDKPCDKK